MSDHQCRINFVISEKLTKGSRGNRQVKNVPKVRKVPKTGAERIREYRARIKALENTNVTNCVTNIDTTTNEANLQQKLDNQDSVSENQGSLLYEALIKKDCKEEKDTGANQQVLAKVDAHQKNRPSLPETATNSAMQIQTNTQKSTRIRRSYKIAKTPAERARAYRERKKTKHTENKEIIIDATHSHVDGIVELGVVSLVSQRAIHKSKSTTRSLQCEATDGKNQHVPSTFEDFGSSNTTIPQQPTMASMEIKEEIIAEKTNKKKDRQRRYREQNREKLKQREAERKRRKQYLQSIGELSSCTDTKTTELNNEERTDDISQSLSALEGIQTLFVEENERGTDKKKEYQRRYREKNREKLTELEAERRKRKQYLQSIGDLSSCSDMKIIQLINKEGTDANSQSLYDLAGTPTSFINEKERRTDKRKERQRRYREQNREKLKQREAERRKRKQYLQSIRKLRKRDINIYDLHNKEGINGLHGLEGIQSSFFQEHERTEENNALQKQEIVNGSGTGKNLSRAKQKQENRHNTKTEELLTSCYVENTQIISEALIKCDKISRNSRNVVENVFIETEITKRYPSTMSTSNEGTEKASEVSTTQQPMMEFLEIKEEPIEEKFPSTSNDVTKNASKASSKVDFTYDPLPIKKEVSDKSGFEFCENKPIANQDPIAIKEEVCEETYIRFHDGNSEENVLLSISELDNPTPSAEETFPEVPIIAFPMPIVAPPMPIVATPMPIVAPPTPAVCAPVDNILFEVPKELDMYDKFMLSKAQDIKRLSNVDDRVTLLNSIERLVDGYLNKDIRFRCSNSNVSGLSSILISPAATVYNPEPITVNTMPSASQIGKGKRKKM